MEVSFDLFDERVEFGGTADTGKIGLRGDGHVGFEGDVLLEYQSGSVKGMAVGKASRVGGERTKSIVAAIWI